MTRLRQRGFTLLELMGSLALIGAVSVVAGGLALHANELRDLGAAYAQDVDETRRALDGIECDVRAARDVRVEPGALTVVTDAGAIRWALDGTSLRRGDLVVARNMAAFRASREGALVCVELRIGRRSAQATRTASVATRVRMRAAQEAPR